MIAIPGDTRTLAERESEYDAFVAANPALQDRRDAVG